MTRNNWIALALLASVAAVGACSPKGGQAGQPDNSAGDRSDLPVSFTVPVGTQLDMTINSELSSRTNKAGDAFTATVFTAVRNESGSVLIPEGSTVHGTVVAVKPAPNRRTPGTLTVALSTIEMSGETFPIRAEIDNVQTEHRNQPISGGDAAKVGAGAAAGAVIGQVLTKDTKGTVVGAVVGGIAGAGVAAETKDMDIVLPVGAHILASITEPLTVE